MAQRFPMLKVDLSKFQKFDIPLPKSLKLYCVLQYSIIASISIYFSIYVVQMSVQERVMLAAIVVVGLFGIGATMEAKHYAGVMEWLRNFVVLLMLFYLPTQMAYGLAVLICISLPFLYIGRNEHDRMLFNQLRADS